MGSCGANDSYTTLAVSSAVLPSRVTSTFTPLKEGKGSILSPAYVGSKLPLPGSSSRMYRPLIAPQFLSCLTI